MEAQNARYHIDYIKEKGVKFGLATEKYSGSLGVLENGHLEVATDGNSYFAMSGKAENITLFRGWGWKLLKRIAIYSLAGLGLVTLGRKVIGKPAALPSPPPHV